MGKKTREGSHHERTFQLVPLLNVRISIFQNWFSFFKKIAAFNLTVEKVKLVIFMIISFIN